MFGPTLASMAQVVAITAFPNARQVQSMKPSDPQLLLAKTGLCKAMSVSGSLEDGDRVGLLRDEANPDSGLQFAVHVLRDSFRVQQTLAARIAQQHTGQILRVQGISLAYTISKAWLQLYATPWWPAFSGSDAIQLAETQSVGGMPQSRAYLESTFQATQPSDPQDSGFLSLGITLLELCFGQPFGDHPKWHIELDTLKALPAAIARKTVATEWLKDVQWHLGVDYAQAASWCLNFATLRNPEWRLEFARNVLEPLQRCCDECLQASQPR